MADYTVTALLASLKRRGMLPSTAEALSDTDYLDFCNEEMMAYIVPTMMSTMEEYFVRIEDFDISTNTQSYYIPYRAMGGNLRLVQLNQNGQTNATWVSIPRIEPEREQDYSYGAGSPVGYLIRNNAVVLLPLPAQPNGILRLQYFIRPNNLVATTAVGTITAITPGSETTTVTCSNIPSTFTTAKQYDLIKAIPGFDTLSFDLNASAVVTGANGTITFSDASAVSDSLAIGDYVCLATESPVAQIPYELHALLAQRVAFKAQEALGDPRAPFAGKVCDDMSARLMKMLSPRSQGSARYIINRYAPGNGYFGFRRWRV